MWARSTDSHRDVETHPQPYEVAVCYLVYWVNTKELIEFDIMFNTNVVYGWEYGWTKPVRCPRCGFENPASFEYCGRCSMMLHVKPSAELPAGAPKKPWPCSSARSYAGTQSSPSIF